MDDTSRPDSPEPHTPSERYHSPASSPGILVLTTALQLLYMNGEARAFCGRLSTHRLGQVVNGIVPAEILELCEEISKKLAVQTSMKDWDRFQLARIAGEPAKSVLLRGFGLPDPGGFAQSRVLILVEELDHAKTSLARRASDRFNLTTREKTVVIYLFKGLTNKEIAGRMMVTEQTVKEFVRHVMEKTGTTTRTGLLSKIILTDPEPDPQAQAFPPSPA